MFLKGANQAVVKITLISYWNGLFSNFFILSAVKTTLIGMLLYTQEAGLSEADGGDRGTHQDFVRHTPLRGLLEYTPWKNQLIFHSKFQESESAPHFRILVQDYVFLVQNSGW